MKIKQYFVSLKKIDINRYRVLHGLKTALACVIGLAIERHYQWPMGQWVPITIMVVMSAQRHFGGALRKAWMRFLGTVGGVVTAVGVLWVFGDNALVAYGTIFIAGIFFAYIASSHGDISYAGTLGGVTMILILASERIGIDMAIQRGFYIVVGIVIALLVSRFVFPVHARDRLRYHVAVTLRNLSKLYLLAIELQPVPDRDKEKKSTKLNSKIVSDIAMQPRLIHEAVVGSREFATNRSIFSAILSSEHSLSRLVNLMYLSLREAPLPELIKQQVNEVADLHNVITNGLNNLANYFELMTEPQEDIDLQGALVTISEAVVRLPKEQNAHQQIVEHSFLFFMQQIIKELEMMRGLIAKVNGKKPRFMV